MHPALAQEKSTWLLPREPPTPRLPRRFRSTSGGTGTFLAYRVQSNTSTTQATTARTGTITLRGVASDVQLTVAQAGAAPSSCAYHLTPFTQAVGGGGGSGAVSLTTGCSWKADSSNSSWLTVTSPGAGTGNTTLTFTVARNPFPTERTANVTVSGDGGSQALTITQSALPIPPCHYTVRPFSQVVPAAGGPGQFQVSANRGGCSYTAVADDGWITVTGGATGEHSGTVSFSAAANDGVQRVGRIHVSWEGGGSTFGVLQDASTPAVTELTLPVRSP